MSTKENHRKYCSIIFALMPLLGIYSIGVPFMSLGQTLFFMAVGFHIMSGNRLKTSMLVVFSIYAVFITLLNILITPNVIVGDEVHDILAWLCFVFTIWGALSYTDYHMFKKALVAFGYISIVFFYVQLILSLVGIKISGLMPLLPLASNWDYQSMVEKQLSSSRLCGFYMEPAHYAENASLFLCFVLYKTSNIKYAILGGLIVTASILLSQSAMGGVMALFVWAWWLLNRFKKKSFVIILILVLSIVPILLSSGLIDSFLLRFSADYFSGEAGEGHFSTYIRTIRGYIPFLESDIVYKFIGHGFGSLQTYILNNPKTDFLSVTDLIPNWINGLSYLLLCTGIIGVGLFITALIKLYRNNSLIGRVMVIIILLLLGSSDSLFLSFQYFYIAKMEKRNFLDITRMKGRGDIAKCIGVSTSCHQSKIT